MSKNSQSRAGGRDRERGQFLYDRARAVWAELASIAKKVETADKEARKDKRKK